MELLMDPATISAITGGVMALGSKVIDGAGKKIGEDVWSAARMAFGKVAEVLHLKAGPGAPELEAEVRGALVEKPALAAPVQDILKSFEKTTGQVLVNLISVNQGAVNVINKVEGGFTQTQTFGTP
jgi:hypothetical protein